ncbi:MAG: hypothetical protein KVP17_004863 [Porospora cf. gigantea B]|uniref:uncharacterized protein n=1 Tax=Porospora cf. gigantea B TaxID=2853592 RepID=UPI003571D71B|nr:MAG: hypothetical protein KVP17_004863 [Porospora cf. gigantea B]
MQTFDVKKLLGTGTFGRVYLVSYNGTQLALKKAPKWRRKPSRENALLRKCVGRQGLVQLAMGAFYTKTPLGHYMQNFVMEYIPNTLTNVLRVVRKKRTQLSQGAVLEMAAQLFEALKELHSLNLVHRDVKPENILVANVGLNSLPDPKRIRLVLCDLGAAKQVGGLMMPHICSRFYRAPELLLGSSNYGTEVDVYSAACVVAEMALLTPLVRGYARSGDPFPHESHQLNLLLCLLGKPSTEMVQRIQDPSLEHVIKALLAVTDDMEALRVADMLPKGSPYTRILDTIQPCLQWDGLSRPQAGEVAGTLRALGR